MAMASSKLDKFDPDVIVISSASNSEEDVKVEFRNVSVAAHPQYHLMLLFHAQQQVRPSREVAF